MKELVRVIGVAFGAVAVIGMALTGCSKETKKPTEPSPSSATPSPSATAPQSSGQPPSPTEKAPTLTPGGPNSFSPSVLAPPAPTALPGNVVTGQ